MKPIARARWMGMALLSGAVLLVPAAAWVGAYPLDGYERTGIRRLKAYRMMQEGTMPGNVRLKPGARLPTTAVKLRLKGVNDTLDIPANRPVDPQLQAGIERIINARSSSYRIAVLDITDPNATRYASIRQDQGYIPGSVGKLLVLTGLFNELKRLYPDDVDARARVLRETMVVADEFAMPNSHTVPVVEPDWSKVVHRSIRLGDEFALWEWVDHMLSPSSNAAGAVVWKEALLLNEFGRRYPPSKAEAAAFFKNTPKAELTDRSIRILEDPLLAMGLDTSLLRLRTFFTRGASQIIPGRGSFASPRTLVRWLVKMEQGKVVDEWSSLEAKRLLYFTRNRYRYAASPALNDAAVYFKSGSLYRCEPEEGFQCGQYMGNAENLMHSVTIVEVPAGGEHPRVYLVSVMSNVLKVNSAAEHMEIGTQIERLMASLHPELPKP
ncbi:MAG TPA: hypothetical protein VLA36_14200 [Longimicrobiales bacterium]|nr:hypothetical protein [Longimicrobiales bacterium]